MGSLFKNIDAYIDFVTGAGIRFSKSFVQCADTQLTTTFEKLVGHPVTKRVEMGRVCIIPGMPYIRKGPTTELDLDLWINNVNHKISISWNAVSGRQYDIADEDIDCADIRFWFSDLDPLRCQREMFPNDPLPFRLKGLTYELTVKSLLTDCNIEMFLKNASADGEAIIRDIDAFINDLNEHSEKKGRHEGVVHSWQSEQAGNRIVYKIDLGSAGPSILRKLLLHLSDINAFTRVMIT